MNVYLDEQGDGPTVVMVHGLGGSANTFEAQANALARSYRLIRPDLPGSARSTRALPQSLEALADQLVAQLSEIAPHAHWVGHSMGAAICQWVAAKYPERVTSLALINPFYEAPPPVKTALAQRALRVRAQGMAEFTDEYLGVALAPESATGQPSARAYLRQSLHGTAPETYAAYCDLLAAHKAPDLSSLHMRTMIVTGDRDTIAPLARAERMRASLLLATLSVLPACGHWSPLEAPYELTALLREHFEMR